MSPIKADSSPWTPTAFAQKDEEEEVFSVFAPAMVPADERSGLLAETLPRDVSVPVTQSMGGAPTKSVGTSRMSLSELSDTAEGS